MNAFGSPLCHRSPERLTFPARVVEVLPKPGGGGFRVRLDQSYFFPVGGGQPADRGWIGAVEVVDALEENGEIWHITRESPGLGEFPCRIDATHRHHYMQQHSGQHLISGALWHLGQFTTLSVHLGESITTIEIDAPEADESLLQKVEALANERVQKGMAIQSIDSHSDKLQAYPLRKPSPVSGPLRLVTLEDFDCSVCCGLHLNHTSQIGWVKYKGSERIRGHIRTHWAIGSAAFEDYRRSDRIIDELKRLFTCSAEELPSQLSGLIGENKRLTAALVALENQRASELLGALLASLGPPHEGVRVVTAVYREPERLVRTLVKSLLERQGLLFCIINQTDECFSWSIGCSSAINLDFNGVKNELLAPSQAKGGGRHPLWQGVAPLIRSAEEFADRFKGIAPNHLRP